MPVKWISAWDKNSGKKLPRRVPDTYLRIFPHLSETPTSRGRRQNTAPVRRTAKTSVPGPTTQPEQAPESPGQSQGESHAAEGR